MATVYENDAYFFRMFKDNSGCELNKKFPSSLIARGLFHIDTEVKKIDAYATAASEIEEPKMTRFQGTISPHLLQRMLSRAKNYSIRENAYLIMGPMYGYSQGNTNSTEQYIPRPYVCWTIWFKEPVTLKMLSI